MERDNTISTIVVCLTLGGVLFWTYMTHSTQIEVAEAADRPLVAKVIKVLDGDTIKIETNIRLEAIDCPENKQPGGLAAGEYLRKRILGKRVAIQLGQRGVYGRFIGRVVDDNEDLNAKLVGEGLCWVYKHSKDPGLEVLQQIAQEEKIGIWAGKPVAPWDWRKEQKRKRGQK